MSSLLKYRELIKAQNLNVDCPSIAEEAEISAFRLCFEPIDDISNFLPNIIEDSLLKKPPRRLLGDKNHCEACGLSFFESLNGCKELLKIFPRLSHTNVSQGLLKKSDGLKGATDHKGHFVFFEYEATILSSKFSIVYTR